MSLYGIQFSINNYMRTTVLSALLVRGRRQQDMFIVIACVRSTQLHFYRYKYFRYKGLQGIGLDLTSEWYGLEGELALYTVFFSPYNFLSFLKLCKEASCVLRSALIIISLKTILLFLLLPIFTVYR